MEFFRIGEMALRAPAQSLRARAPATRPRTFRCAAPRAFSTSIRRRQEDRPSPSETRSGVDDDVSSLLDSALDGTKGVPTAPQSRSSKFKSRDYQPNNPPSRGASMGEYTPRAGSSVDDLLAAMGPGKRNARASGRSAAGPNDISRMLDPYNNTSVRPAPPPVPQSSQLLPFKLNASVGRTVYTNQSTMDPARAFRALEMQCARNSVRRDFMRQRFHERPGLKRKRLHSERWRRRFKEGFRGVVGMVQKMRKQGW